MKRVNIRLKDEIHTKAKIISVLKDVTMNDYIERALERAIEQDSNLLDRIKKKL
jgi:predicted HicB family RNase H-like nuclease